MTVGELGERMGAGEFAQWLALRRVEPWGPYRHDALATLGWSYLVAGPNVKDPGKLIGDIRLPWWDDKGPKARDLSPEEFRRRLIAMGGQEIPRG